MTKYSMEISLPPDINIVESCNEATAIGISTGELEAQFMGKIRRSEVFKVESPGPLL